MAKSYDVLVNIDAKTARAVAGVSRVSNSLSQLTGRAKSADRTIKAIATAVGSFYVLSKAIDVAKIAAVSFTNTAAQFETFEATLTAIQGSSDAAKQSMGWIKDFAKTTPFEIDQVTDSFVKLKAYGLDPQHGLMKTLGNTAAAMGKDINQAVEAVADAVQGENERLKEFGIKASVQGQKVAYTWADSSGKMRNITIANNKDMIQSTLEAIWNEKYAGAMAARANTWQGMVSNLSDSWTNFKAEIMDAGLFDYIKGILKTVSQYLGGAFDKAKGGAKGFSDAVIGGIKSSIQAVSVLGDTFSLFKGVFGIVKAAFWELVGVFGTGMNTIQKAWNTLGNTMSSLWANVANGVKEIFSVMINYIIDKINGISETVNKAANAVGLDPVFGKLEHVTFEKTKANITALGEPISNVQTAWKYAADAQKEYTDSFKSFASGEYQQKAKQLITDIDKNIKTLKESEAGSNEEKKKAAELLDKLGAKYGGLSSAAKKTSKTTAKAAQEALNMRREYYKLIGDNAKVFSIDATNKLQKMMKSGLFSQEELSNAYDAMWRDFTKKGEHAAKSVADRLQEAFGIQNDSVFGHLFDNLLNSFSSFGDAFKSGNPFSVANATGDLIGSSLDTLMPGLGTAVKTFGAMLSNTLSEAQIKAAAGRTTFDSKGTQQIVETLKKYQDPQLTATRQMLTHLESMDKNLLSALASSAALDLSGSNFTPKTSSVLGGVLFASSTELIGSGIKFYDQAVSSFVKGVEADKYEAVKKTSTTLGIFTSEKIKESTSELPTKIAKQLGAAFQDGIDAASTALDTLGLNTDAIKQKINDYVVSIGKVNLKDLSPEEQAKAINAALTEQLNNAVSGAINAIASPENIAKLNSLQLAGEEYVQSLVRIATEHETVRQQLALFGQTVTDFATSDALVQAAGGLDQFKSAMDTFVRNFFSEGEQKQFLQQQLSYALQVYNVSLPASKAQFKALVLETQQKIINVKATISTLKAEIAAKVAAGKMSLAAAYGELQAKGQIAQAQANVIKGQVSANNYLIDSAHNAGRAAVGFGKSIHSSIEAMAGRAAEAAVDGAKTAVDAAGNIDYSRITSPAIAAAEAELANLEGLYGTLMSNMGSFADYYGGVESAASAAADKLDRLTRSLIAIADLKGQWGGDPVEAARLKLDATRAVTGLYDVTYGNFLKKFTALTKDGKGLEDDVLKKWQDMSAALRGLHDAQEAANKGLNDFKKNARTAFENLFTESMAQTVGSLDRAINRKDYSGAMSAYNKSLENLKNSATSRENYFLNAARLNDRIQRIKPDNPNAGVEKRLDKINEEIHSLREEQARLQGQVVRNTDKPLIVEAV